MSGLGILVIDVSTAGPSDRAAAWATRLAGAWPTNTPPSGLSVLPSDRLEDATLDGLDAVLLLGMGEPCGAALWCLLDRLAEYCVPIVALGHSGSDCGIRRRAGEVMLEPESAPADRVALLLATLALRQPAVREIRRENSHLESLRDRAETVMSRMNDELLLASSVQREFLPRRLPGVRCLDAAVLFRPVSYVSGDIYDLRRLDEDHIGFFMADAMGHGVPAALMTLFISGCIRQKEVLVDPSGPANAEARPYRLLAPSQTLSQLNRELCNCRAGPARFATAVCGILRISDRTVTLASAGHPRAICVPSGASVPTTVETNGMMLGVVEEYPYEDIVITLKQGESLLIHSDGLEPALRGAVGRTGGGETQPENPGLADHVSVLASLVAPPERSLSEAIADLSRHLDEQAGSLHQVDDITVLALALGREASTARVDIGRQAAA